MKTTRAGLLLASIAGAVALAGCGGGTEGTGGVPPPAAASYSTGVMTVGSVVVNGVRYDDTNATIIIDDNTAARSQLRDGMVVKVRGRINADGVTGTAERIEVENELRGTVTTTDPSANPPTFTVSGVLVRTDDATVFANGVTIDALRNAKVEVHGLRDAAGVLRATRVEVQNGTGLADEFKGTITVPFNGTTFGIGAVAVTVNAQATFSPAGCNSAGLTAERIVEVHGTFTGINQFSATRIDCEDLEDESNGVKPPAGARTEFEGFVTALTADANLTAGSFTLGSITVNFDAGTQVRNGAREDLANGVRIEVDGTLSGTTLTAREISFKSDRIVLQGQASGVTPTQFTVLGQTVVRNNLTQESVSGGLADGTRVQVRARFTSTGSLVAEEVRDASGNVNREIVQARVTAKTATTITLLGTPYTLLEGANRYERPDGTFFPSRADFLAAITAAPTGGTLVKVRGTPLSAGVEEAEIEL
ncbi:MAG: DUF5666 domain-containing protein [Pseudomonadota bacterium]